MDNRLLRTFVVVAETRNFTRAANRLNCVQSAVSMQVKRLEDTVQTRLLERTNREVKLTSQGEIFLRFAHRVLHLTDETLAELGNSAKSGRVRFAATDMSIGFMTEVLQRVKLHHPLVEIELLCMKSRDALEALEADRIDLAFVTQNCGRTGGKLIARMPLAWVSSRKVDVAAMNPLPVALFEPDCIYRKAAISALDKYSLPYRLAYESPSRAGLICIVEAGLALTVLPANCVRGTLRDVSDKLPTLPDLKTYIFGSGASKPSAVQALADALAETLG